MQEVQDLIECFPDTQQHLKQLARSQPKKMTIEKFTSLLKCPPIHGQMHLREGARGGIDSMRQMRVEGER